MYENIGKIRPLLTIIFAVNFNGHLLRELRQTFVSPFAFQRKSSFNSPHP